MASIAKSFKNKIHLFLSKGYKIKVDEKSYMIFEKEEDYLILINLERIFFDLFKIILFINEDKEIRVFFRMTLIEKYLKYLHEIKLKSFYNKKCVNPFKIRFPNLRHLEYFHYSGVLYNVTEDLENSRNRELIYKFLD